MRRSAGEGTISKRTDGMWRVAVRVHGQRRYLYAKTRKGVVEKLREMQQRVARGETVQPEKLTLADYLDRWLADAIKPNSRVRTYEAHDYVRRRLIVPQIGRVRLNKLTALDVQRMLRDLAEEGKSARQQQSAYVTLRAALQQAVKWDLIPNNPVAKVGRPRTVEREPRALTPREVVRLIDAATDDPYEPLVVLMVFCGLRWGEAVGLQWGDVDFRRRLISIRRAVEETNEGVRMGELKSRAARRSVALPREVVEALKRHRAALGAAPIATKLVFTDARGGMMRRGNFGRRHWRPIREAAGLDDVRVHDLRHTAATLALRAGSDRHGRRAFQGFLGECKPLQHLLRRVRPTRRVEAVGWLVFAAEGAVLGRKLVFKSTATLERWCAEACLAGVPAPAELLELGTGIVQQNLPLLQECRRQAQAAWFSDGD